MSDAPRSCLDAPWRWRVATFDASVHPTRDELVVAGPRGLARIDASLGSVLTQRSEAARTVLHALDGRHLVTTAESGVVVRDAETLAPLRRLATFPSLHHVAAFTDDAQVLVGTSVVERFALDGTLVERVQPNTARFEHYAITAIAPTSEGFAFVDDGGVDQRELVVHRRGEPTLHVHGEHTRRVPTALGSLRRRGDVTWTHDAEGVATLDAKGEVHRARAWRCRGVRDHDARGADVVLLYRHARGTSVALVRGAKRVRTWSAEAPSWRWVRLGPSWLALGGATVEIRPLAWAPAPRLRPAPPARTTRPPDEDTVTVAREGAHVAIRHRRVVRGVDLSAELQIPTIDLPWFTERLRAYHAVDLYLARAEETRGATRYVFFVGGSDPCPVLNLIVERRGLAATALTLPTLGALVDQLTGLAR